MGRFIQLQYGQLRLLVGADELRVDRFAVAACELDELLASARRDSESELKLGVAGETALLREVEQRIRSSGRA